MRASRSLRHGALALLVVLAACGGNKNDDTTTSTTPPNPNARYPALVPLTASATLDASGSTMGSGGALTYVWALTSKPTGSAATVVNPTAVQATLTPDVAGAYSLTLTVGDGTRSQSVPFALTATAFTPPTILSDLVEPVSGTVQLSLSTYQLPSTIGTTTVTWTVDGNAIATGAAVPWYTTVTDGPHVVTAQVQSSANYVFSVSRTFQVMQNTVSFTSATISETTGAFTAIVGAQSVNGILSVSATLDGVTIGNLATPNACTDPTGAACTSGSNGYGFSGRVTSGAHVVVVTATDGIGRQLGTQLRLSVTDVP